MGSACSRNAISSTPIQGKTKETLVIAKSEPNSNTSNNGRENDRSNVFLNDDISFVQFLRTKWAGSVLNWTEEDLKKFSSCFQPHKVKEGKEVCIFTFGILNIDC